MGNSQRPGVYSEYTVVAAAGTAQAKGFALVIAKGSGEKVLEVFCFASVAEIVATEGYLDGSPALAAGLLLLQAGAAKVYVIAVSAKGQEPTLMQYEQALALGRDLEDVRAVIVDSAQTEVLQKARDSTKLMCEAMKEQLLFGGVDDVDAALALRTALQSERVCLCCPAAEVNGVCLPLFTAAAFAAKVLALQSPAHTLSWQQLAGVTCNRKLTEAQIDRLILGGVTPFEPAQGGVRCIRAVNTGMAPLRSINTVLMIDHVIGFIRESLTALLQGPRGIGMDSVASQIAVLLGVKQDEGLLTSFEAPVVRGTADPEVCVAELSFRVATVVNIIRILAHIRV